MFLRVYFVILFYLPVNICIPVLNGRYTRDIQNYNLVVPRRLSPTGRFVNFQIPHYFKHDFDRRRKKRSSSDEQHVNYGIKLGDKRYQLRLWPNHAFLAPDALVETREPRTPVKHRRMSKLNERDLCHYTGVVRGVPNSRVAVSTCHGLAGYILLKDKRYFIEPLEDHQANGKGQLLHVAYEQQDDGKRKGGRSCGTSDNWEDVWRDRLREKYMEEMESPRGKRALTSLHRYLETLIVCDKKFIKHHKHHDIETYVLTVMNMVFDFYHDSTSGNQMDVIVVRILYLEKEEEEIDLMINQNADDTLASFCKWQQRINPKDKENPNHHDIAVLLTRHDICAENVTKCGLQGLAYVASACTGNEPCAINEDSGLVLGIVVAHEMGHVMGCAHDKEGESDCPATDADGSYFIMAPFVHLFTTKWSTCSRGFMTALFDNDLGECLNDEPQQSLYKEGRMLPGVVYDADAQCQMQFPDSKVCIIDKETFCEKMMCQTAPNSCLSNEEPYADGTKCGDKKWCYRKQCVAIGERPDAINGGWGPWGDATPCSKTCGGGVSVQERDCTNPPPSNKGRYCLGERKKITTCNMQPCAVGAPSFREVQCKAHDNKPVNDKMYTWKSFFKEDEPCVLYCLNNENVFMKLEPRAKDGTRCKPGTKNMCISGTCMKVGCDGIVNSEAVEDVCGICNGDGTQCKTVDDVNKEVGQGYMKVVTIPSGSRNILVEEVEASGNTLAVGDKSGTTYYMNGGFAEEPDGAKKFGEVEGVYSHPEPDKEKLIIHGPLTEDLVIYYVFYDQTNNGVRYKYSEPAPETEYLPKYHWEILDWGDCSAKCGGGTQEASLSCVEDRAGKVSPSFCQNHEKPEGTTKKCNEQVCKTKWRVGKWGKCHACKFKSGVRMREVECVRESPKAGTEDILVEDIECKGPKPGTRELCNSHKKCKTRRSPHELPEHMMRDIWFQTAPLRKNRDNHNIYDRKCEPKLDVGKIVKDYVAPDEIKIEEIPLKPSKILTKESDLAFEQMGDQVGDTLDVKHAKMYTGKDAAYILKKLQHKNGRE